MTTYKPYVPHLVKTARSCKKELSKLYSKKERQSSKYMLHVASDIVKLSKKIYQEDVIEAMECGKSVERYMADCVKSHIIRSSYELLWKDFGCPAVTVDDGLLSVMESTVIDGPMGEYVKKGLSVIGENIFTINTSKWSALVANTNEVSDEYCMKIADIWEDTRTNKEFVAYLRNFAENYERNEEGVISVIYDSNNSSNNSSIIMLGMNEYDENKDIQDVLKNSDKAAILMTILRILLYVSLYPEAVKTATFGKCVVPSESVHFLTSRTRCCGLKEEHREHASPSMHFRKFHFRRYPIRPDGSRREGIVFVSACVVNGKHKHVDASCLNSGDIAES